MVSDSECRFDIACNTGSAEGAEFRLQLADLNIIYNLVTTASKCNKGNNVELPGWGPEDWLNLVAVWRKSVAWKVTCVEIWTV